MPATPVTHWSVDFVKHLRLIHFLLMAISAFVIVAEWDSSHEQMPRAFAQATQIADLQDRWEDVQHSFYLQAAKQLDKPVRDFFYSALVTITFVPPAAQRVIANVYFTESERVKYAGWKFSDPAMAAAPHTVGEFRDWWNRLHEGLEVRILYLEPQTPQSCEAQAYDHDTGSAIQVPTVCEFGEPGGVRIIDAVPEYKNVEDSIASLKQQGVSLAAKPVHVLVQSNVPNAFDAKSGAKSTIDLQIFLPLMVQSSILKESALKDIFRDFRDGTYAQAFPELDSVAIRDLSNTPLKTLQTLIKDLRHPIEQQIEVVGIKFDAANLARWGLLLVLTLQLYFWIHLHEFKTKIDPNSPGREVAWIGVYRTRTAMVAAIISACALPFAAVAVLMIRTINDSSSTLDILLHVIGLAASMVLAALAAERLLQVRINLSASGP